MSRFVFVLLCTAALSIQAQAAEPVCRLVSTFSAVDLSGGATTTAQFPTAPTVSTRSIPIWSYLKVSLDLTDANSSVSNLRVTPTSSNADGGTFRKLPLCVDAAPSLTCGAVYLDWDPQTHGKSWWLKPIDWGYDYGKLTLTPTGHGAGDTVTVTVYGCWE